MSLDERETVHPAYSTPEVHGATAGGPSVSGGGSRHARHSAPDEVGVEDGHAGFFDDPNAHSYAHEHPYDENAEAHDDDVFGVLYVPDPGEDGGLDGHVATATLLQAPPRRSLERERKRKRRRRWLLLLIAVVILVVVAAAGLVGYKSFQPTSVADWTGPGTGQVRVQVHSGDGAEVIGTTLAKAGVVASVSAYTRASAENSKSADIQPGTYQLREHMSGAAAVNLLLDPAAHLELKMVIPEGTIEKDVITKMAAALNVPEATVAAAAKDVANLGLPDGYAAASGPLTSAEGFLFPDTYSFDPGTTPVKALQAMASEFTTEDRQIAFADGAKKLGITPYQALIIASIAQSEVKFDTDANKVARVILNRIAAGMPLQIDATSAYAAKLQGIDPTTIQYADIDSPYNTYHNKGLPPTPIGNPGESVLKAAISPTPGDWLYYVNGDAEGHLFFTDDQNAFAAAVAQCQAQHWGCG